MANGVPNTASKFFPYKTPHRLNEIQETSLGLNAAKNTQYSKKSLKWKFFEIEFCTSTTEFNILMEFTA